jgi:hypothetical protein
MTRPVLAALALLCVFAFAAPAYGLLLANPDGTPTGYPWREWADAALVPLPPGTVTFHDDLDGAPCVGVEVEGCALWSDDGTAADVWVIAGMPAFDSRRVELHELGHIFDGRVMTGAARAAWKAAVMDHRDGWFQDDDPEPSGERFAESYSLCAILGGHIRSAVRGVYGYVVGPVRQRRVCRVLRLAGVGYYGTP